MLHLNLTKLKCKQVIFRMSSTTINPVKQPKDYFVLHLQRLPNLFTLLFANPFELYNYKAKLRFPSAYIS